MSDFSAMALISSALFMETSEKGIWIPGERKRAGSVLETPADTWFSRVNWAETLMDSRLQLNYMQVRPAM
jgi:hypothetical protein